ncbi:M48 family metallopeptidase [Sphingomonas sp. GB1N7]
MAACLAATQPAFAKGDAVPALPTYTAAYEPQGVDERGLWMEVDEVERAMRDSKAIITDPKLNQYVRDVVCRTVGEDRCRTVRVYIVRDASFNASMFPNGMMLVHTGLLLRARDEAEMASVLGHEFAHFELRHSLNGFKQRRTATDIFAWAGVAAAGAYQHGGPGAYQTVRTAQAVQAGAVRSIYSHSREQERQADLLSMAYLRKSPYDPHCFSRVWTRLMDEADATAHGRRQRSTRYDRVSFFSTHPTQLERASYLRDIADGMNKTGDDEAERYRTALESWRPQLLADQIKLNDFEGTDYLLTGLAGERWTGPLLFARGELYRTRGHPRDLVSAVAFYRDAIAQDATNADAYRGMGLAQLRSRDPQAAGTLKKYLAMKPDASDSAMISTLLQ